MKRSPAALALCFLMAGGTALADPSHTHLDGARAQDALGRGAISDAAHRGLCVRAFGSKKAGEAAGAA